MERRKQRSNEPSIALQYLLESVAARSEIEALAIVNAQGAVVAGVGTTPKLCDLAGIAAPAVRGEACAEFENVTKGTDFLGREIELPEGSLYLAALGTRVGRMGDAARAVIRICSSSA